MIDSSNTVEKLENASHDTKGILALFEIIESKITSASDSSLAKQYKKIIMLNPVIKLAWNQINDICDSLQNLKLGLNDASFENVIVQRCNHLQVYADITYQIANDLYFFDRENNDVRAGVLTLKHLKASILLLNNDLESLYEQLQSIINYIDNSLLASQKEKGE